MEALSGQVEYGEREHELEAGQNYVRDAMRVLRKQWLMVLLPLVCVIAVVFVMTKRKVPVYEASAKIRIAAPGSNSSSAETLQQLLEGKHYGGLGTQIEILRSPELLKLALDGKKLKGTGDPQIAVSQIPDTDVVFLTVWWDEPEECAQIANWLVDTYDREGQKESRKAITSTLKEVRKKIAQVRPQLDAAELRLRAFQQRNEVVELPAQAGAAVTKLAAAENQRQTAEMTLAQIRMKLPVVEKRLEAAPETIVASRGLAKNPILAGLEQNLQTLQLKKADLLIEHVETSPKVQEVEAQIKNVEDQITKLVGDEIGKPPLVETGSTVTQNPEYQAARDQLIALRADQLATQAQLTAAQRQEAEAKALVRALPGKQYELANLQREIQLLNASYQDLRHQQQALELAQSAQVSSVTVLDRAVPNFNPVSPNVRVNMILATVLGLLLGLGLAYVREFMGDTLDTAGHIHASLGLPVIGAVPALKGARKGLALHRRDELTPEMEGYHFIASALPVGHRESSTRTLLLTSAGSGHGNSTTVANLATAFAQRQKAVVLVDLDLRKPSLHTLFNIAESPGISDVIAGRKLLAEALHPTAVEGLLVMPAGTVRDNPIRTLSSPTLPVVLQDLANVADVVLIDSPPCVTVTDASIIAPSADGTILLLRAGATDRRTAQRARSILSTVGASLLGVILNRAGVGLEGFAYARQYRRVSPPALGPGA